MIVYGKRVCLYILENHSHLIEEIYLNKNCPKDIFYKLKSLKKPIINPDSKKMQALSRGGNHQGYLFKLDYARPKYNFKNFQGYSKIVVIVDVTDVGNIGSIFRSAYALGIDGIVCSNTFSESGAARSSSGAFFDMPYFIHSNILSLINEFKMSGFKLFGSALKGDSIDSIPTYNKWALFLGSEGDGLSNRILNKMDHILSIKMANFNSLNVSVAAGILIHGMVKNEMH